MSRIAIRVFNATFAMRLRPTNKGYQQAQSQIHLAKSSLTPLPYKWIGSKDLVRLGDYTGKRTEAVVISDNRTSDLITSGLSVIRPESDATSRGPSTFPEPDSRSGSPGSYGLVAGDASDRR
jgi:hypothetical protein